MYAPKSLPVQKFLSLGMRKKFEHHQQETHHFQDHAQHKKRIAINHMKDLKCCANKVAAIAKDQQKNSMFDFHRMGFSAK